MFPMNQHPSLSVMAHTYAIPHLLSALRTNSETGLSTAEARSRLTEYGVNELKSVERASPWVLLLAQFKNVLIIILLIAAVLSAVLGHGLESGAIAVIVLFAALLGFLQEYRAEKAIDALRKMAAPTATVLRDGEEMEIAARELVPGDVVILSTGDRIPADGRLIESVRLQADEAVLTGESLPVEKQTEPIEEHDAPLGDRKSMVYGGTAVTYGRGMAVITATGMHTEFGKIAGMLQGVEAGETPLQRNLHQLGKTLAYVALGIVFVVVIIALFRGQPLLDMFVFGVSLAVAVVPEALPAVVTISLAIGVQRMVKRHALVRRLSAVETLGSTSVICSDKTGTLTKDEMTVCRILSAGRTITVSGAGYEPHGIFSVQDPDGAKRIDADAPLLDLLRAACLASDARLIHHEHDGWDIKGDPTEGALIVAAAKAKLQKDVLDEEQPRIAEIPFTSETKRMTTLHRTKEGEMACAKGAPEVLVQSCDRVRTKGGVEALTKEGRAEILRVAKHMAESSLRVLAVASKEDARLADAEEGMVFLGLLGMMDPLRPEARAAVEKCRRAGIRVIMITGDHPVTAQAIAQELGIMGDHAVVTGTELENMSDATLEQELDDIAVFARVSPAHKLQVVTALQKRGHVVAMTGDGVNDAPSLKKADIGIAMGITGTDVTREASAMTLTDDNFASIVAAVEEGRAIFGNIRKYLTYLLSSNVGEMFLVVGATVIGQPLPLTAVQILVVNLVTDGLPALALAFDPPDADLMQRPPRDPRRSIFGRRVVALMMTGGVWSMIVNLGIFTWALRDGRSLTEAMTMTFLSLALIQFFKAYNFRSDRVSILRKPFANMWLNVAILLELPLLALILYVPVLHKPFGTMALPLDDVLLVTLLAFTVTPVLEIAKWGMRKVR
jgi:Ca2+-transporting ATPase